MLELRNVSYVVNDEQGEKQILKNAARYVRPGGVLIFSTCTLNKEEIWGDISF